MVSDDINDAYRRLRRLVMDYLGITPASPSDAMGQSNTTSAFGLEKEVTDMTTAGTKFFVLPILFTVSDDGI